MTHRDHCSMSERLFYPQMTQIDADVSICVHLRHLRISNNAFTMLT